MLNLLLAWLEAEGIVSKPRQGCNAAQDVANAGESEIELKPEPGPEPEPEPEPAPCTYLTGKRKRTCGLELTGSSDIKSESDSDNFGNLGEGDEIICVEHLVCLVYMYYLSTTYHLQHPNVTQIFFLGFNFNIWDPQKETPNLELK